LLGCAVLLLPIMNGVNPITTRAASNALDPSPPAQTVRLIFIHHSTGENWLADDNGGLGIALRNNNYFVSDTNYGWGPLDLDQGSDYIGDHTDIPHWYSWFTGPHRATYLAALYAETEQHSSYSRRPTNPGGPNTIIMFKSCFPNSNLGGNPNDPPASSADNFSDLTVANAKRIYLDLLNYFAAHQEKLFVVITAPPLRADDTTPAQATNARAFNNWLMNDWLDNYPHQNVAVFDFYTVLTSNGGNPDTNDLGAPTGNHHRYRNGAIEHITNQGGNTSAYPTGDSHPSQAGNQKATGEFVPLLNIFYHRWQASLTPDLSTSTKQANTGRVQAGDRVTYTIVLHNTGQISATTYLTDVTPTGVQLADYSCGLATGGGSAPSVPPPTNCSGGLVAWHGVLTTTHTITLTFGVTITANTTQAIMNTAIVAVSGTLPFTRSAVVIVNGYATFLPVILK
jgi:uncharacterized repeat protein (TIGR01451 family)